VRGNFTNPATADGNCGAQLICEWAVKKNRLAEGGGKGKI